MIRFFDILFSGLALLVLMPLLLPIAIALRLTGEGEVFYRQVRVGKNSERFRLWKFATMLKDSPNIGTGVMTVKDDPRVLPFGGILRKTKINELPQLLNILSGEMSVIGPRPQAESVFEMFPEERREQITSVQPGLSGIGSILFRDEETVLESASDKADFYANTISPYKAEVECWFAEHRSVRLYFTLIFLTVWVVVFSRSKMPWRLLPDLPRPVESLRVAFSLD